MGFDGAKLLLFLAFVFVVVVSPLFLYFTNDVKGTGITQTVNRIFWPGLTAIAMVIALQNISRLRQMHWAPHLVFLVAYLCLAGASVLWAINPEVTLKRFVRQVLIVTPFVLPAMLVFRPPDLLRVAFLCFAGAAILNLYFVFENSPALVLSLDGYSGYFNGKNALGQFAAAASLLALHEVCYPGYRRLFGIFIVIVSITLLFWANSKTAIGLTFVMPFLAFLVLSASRLTRTSPAILLALIPVGYFVITKVTGITFSRISYMIYGDPTFTGRTIIWSFTDYEISLKPLLGWGYKSFWLSGGGGKSAVTAPGWVPEWVATMPHSHDGYRDVLLETGYAGLTILLCFIFATVHAIGHVAVREPRRAWGLLTIALFVISANFMESLWFRGTEFLWMLFLIVAAEAARSRRPSATPSDKQRRRTAQPVRVLPLRNGYIRHVRT